MNSKFFLMLLLIFSCVFLEGAGLGRVFGNGNTEAISEGGILYGEPDALMFFKGDASFEHLAKRFYQAGAVYVGVIQIMEEPGGLRVYLPVDPDARERVLKIANEVLLGSGFGSVDDEGQDSLTVWFK